MKNFKSFYTVALVIFMIFTQNLFAEENQLSLTLTTDAAYYPQSDRITGTDHFAPITGPYSGLEGCTTLYADYKINTPLGESWLVKDASVLFEGALEVTPISVRPKASIEFQPLPFFVLKTGGSVGFGWNLGGIEGLCELNKVTCDYEKLSTFNHPFYEVWGSATFMFDTGAIISGDWTHVVMLATYKTFYTGIAGLDSDAVYEWQCSKGKARGLQYEFQGILGYQMPLTLSLAGFMFKSTGHYNGADYALFNDNYNGAFAELTISPVMQFKFGAKDELYCLLDFSSRRSFDSKFEKEGESLYLTATGREWFFQRIAFSWTHKFM